MRQWSPPPAMRPWRRYPPLTEVLPPATPQADVILPTDVVPLKMPWLRVVAALTDGTVIAEASAMSSLQRDTRGLDKRHVAVLAVHVGQYMCSVHVGNTR